jgi:hypothetical protein
MKSMEGFLKDRELTEVELKLIRIRSNFQEGTAKEHEEEI